MRCHFHNVACTESHNWLRHARFDNRCSFVLLRRSTVGSVIYSRGLCFRLACRRSTGDGQSVGHRNPPGSTQRLLFVENPEAGGSESREDGQIRAHLFVMRKINHRDEPVPTSDFMFAGCEPVPAWRFSGKTSSGSGSLLAEGVVVLPPESIVTAVTVEEPLPLLMGAMALWGLGFTAVIMIPLGLVALAASPLICRRQRFPNVAPQEWIRPAQRQSSAAVCPDSSPDSATEAAAFSLPANHGETQQSCREARDRRLINKVTPAQLD